MHRCTGAQTRRCTSAQVRRRAGANGPHPLGCGPFSCARRPPHRLAHLAGSGPSPASARRVVAKRGRDERHQHLATTLRCCLSLDLHPHPPRTPATVPAHPQLSLRLHPPRHLRPCSHLPPQSTAPPPLRATRPQSCGQVRSGSGATASRHNSVEEARQQAEQQARRATPANEASVPAQDRELSCGCYERALTTTTPLSASGRRR